MGDYLRESMREEHGDDFAKIRTAIAEALKDYPNFIGVDFSDVHAGGIQIGGLHKEITGFYYASMPTIKYNFSNIDEAVKEFVDGWKTADNPESVGNFKRFLELGSMYGWD